MKGFLAIVLNMGLLQQPEIEDYWSTAWSNNVPFFSSLMARNRFEAIFWQLHIGKEPLDQPQRRIHKVKSFLDALVGRFQACYTAGREVAIDETMVGFRGRFGPRQYMPQKPTKWGIKAYTMADSSNGYMLNILLYMGRETLLDVQPPPPQHLPIPAKVVLSLMTPYLDRGHHLYCDRYYSSIPLVQELEKHDTAFTGIINRNRVDLPNEVRLRKTMKKGEVKAYRCGNLLVMAWREKKKSKHLIMISSAGNAQMMTTSIRGQEEPVVKPVLVDQYNHYMNGVDRADQLTVYYSFTRKTKKWWRKIFFWLLEVSTVNSYILYKEAGTSRKSHLDFRRSVITSLAEQHLHALPPRPARGRPRKRSRENPERLDQRKHFLDKGSSQRACVVCSDIQKNQRHTTTYFCKTCTVHPYLHPVPCFERYHTITDFRIHY